MKRILLMFVVCSVLIMCSCDKKNDSLHTESQKATETQKTSLTIASQSATVTTTTTTAATTEKTEFTSKDMYHTEQEEMQEIKDFCEFVCKKWTAVYNGGADFDFAPYCRFENLAKYLVLETKAKSKPSKFSDSLSAHLMELSYTNNGGIVRYTAVYSYDSGFQGKFTFIVQSSGGQLKLCDMIYDAEDSYDIKYRDEQMKNMSLDYWALCDYDELVRRIESDEKKINSTE